jgi:pantetheine-phosphate adenylyltransferase
MKRIAVFPGSFDPITKGHESVILRSLGLFDTIIVAVGRNSEKKYMFPLEQRLQWIRDVFADYPQIIIDSYEGLTTEFCRKNEAGFILRGLRTSADFEFERSISQMNKKMLPGIETVFLMALPEYNALSSSIIRDIYRNQGDITTFIPEKIKLKIGQ